MDTSGRVSLRASHMQVILVGALRKWKIWCSGSKNAFVRADGSGRDVYLRASAAWGPWDCAHIRKLRAPAYGLNDAPSVFRRPLRKYFLNTVDLLADMGLQFRVLSSDPSLFFVFRKESGAVGAIAAYDGGTLGRREPDVPSEARVFLERRSEPMGVQESSVVHVGLELPKESDFSVKSTEEEFATNLEPPPTST